MKKMAIAMVLTWILITVPYGGNVWADGGREPAWRVGCDIPPNPANASPVIHGQFLATYVQEKDGSESKKYSIQCYLKRSQWDNKKGDAKNIAWFTDEKNSINSWSGSETEAIRLHSFEKTIREVIPLCNYSEKDLYDKYWPRPCNQEIQNLFNLEGFPVLSELKILKCEGEGDDAKMHGSFKIRVVPKRSKGLKSPNSLITK